MALFRHPPLWLAIPAVTLLAACATTPPEATVQVFTPQPRLMAGTAYRHERLPSQAAPPNQAELEAVADAALARAGLRRDDANARLAVQVSSRRDVVQHSPWGGGWGWGGPSVGIGLGGGSGGGFGGVGLSFPIGGGGAPRGTQQVDVQLRDLGSGQVVYQSVASSSAGVHPAALMQAALRDFPNSPPGVRQVPLGQ